MPTFQHGKNAFLALGFENATSPINTYTSMNTTTFTGTAGTLVTTGSLLASDNVLYTNSSGTSYYGFFANAANSQSLSPLPSLTVPLLTATQPTTSSTSITSTTAIAAGATSGTGYLLPMWNISPYINDVDFPTAIAAEETTSFNAAGVKSFIVGLKDYTVTFSGHYDSASTIFGLTGLDAAMQSALNYQNNAGQFISFVYGPTDPGAFAGGSASVKYYGQGILTKYDLKSTVSGVVTFDAEMQVTGVVSRSLI
jgi:hypothetical protein